jgi:hypothetical protein
MQLVLNHLGRVLLPLVEFLESLLHAFVIFLHLDDVVLKPALLELLVLLSPSLLELDLGVSLLQDITHQHL